MRHSRSFRDTQSRRLSGTLRGSDCFASPSPFVEGECVSKALLQIKLRALVTQYIVVVVVVVWFIIVVKSIIPQVIIFVYSTIVV
jgi:hypothetical protein